MERFVKLINRASDLTGKALSPSLIALTLVLMYEVVARHLFNEPTVWAHELAGFIFVVAFMFGGAYALRHNTHVSVDIVYNKFSLRKRGFISIFTSLFLLLICWAFLYQGWLGAASSLKMLEHSATFWSPPIYPVKVLIVIAMVLFTLQAVANLIRDFYMAISGKVIG